jgi:hypothetical protein
MWTQKVSKKNLNMRILNKMFKSDVHRKNFNRRNSTFLRFNIVSFKSLGVHISWKNNLYNGFFNKTHEEK